MILKKINYNMFQKVAMHNKSVGPSFRSVCTFYSSPKQIVEPEIFPKSKKFFIVAFIESTYEKKSIIIAYYQGYTMYSEYFLFFLFETHVKG